MKITSMMLASIMFFEGFSPAAKWDVNACRNGYGTPATNCNEIISKKEAEKRLKKEISNLELWVYNNYENVSKDQGLFDASVSMAYNMGRTGSSDIIRELDYGHYECAKLRMFKDRTNGGLPGLVKRRKFEYSVAIGEEVNVPK